jgi:hydrophobic/amphiphilic exporter-1 (mainly G- bacteria), HAE1 family
MNWIEAVVRWRHGTFVLFCLLGILGWFSVTNLPLELQPGGDRPEITITTPYSGAGPREVEDLITRPIEERMQEVQGLNQITSASRSGRSSITLEFREGVDLEQRLVEVINQLNQVPSLPIEAGESSVRMVSGDSSPMMWIPLDTQPNFVPDPDRYRDLAEEIIVPRLRKVEGTGQFLVVGGQQREVEVLINPKALADRNLTVGDVVRGLRENNRDIRGGPMTVGRRDYRVRTVSRSTSLAGLETFVLRRDGGGLVTLKDVATVRFGRKLKDSVLLFNDKPAVAIGVIRQVGANVPVVAAGVRKAIAQLQQEFDTQKVGIQFDYTYDESEYVSQAVAFVQENLLSGAVLAIGVLLLFLGSLRTVAVIAITIPIAVLLSFISMAALGRTLNIISLAGLAFSVGMIVDNAIVVIENIFTHLQQGKRAMQAAIDGTQEVWSAMLGSTLSNVVVFVPIRLVTGEAGQLYADMAIALSAASLFSLFAAFTLVPMLSGLFLRESEAQQMLTNTWIPPQGPRRSSRLSWFEWLERSVFIASSLFRRLQAHLERFLLRTVQWSLGSGRLLRRLLILAIPLGLLGVSILLLPPLDYLPEGNRNQIQWRFDPMPGTGIAESLQQSEPIRAFVREQPEVDRTMFIDRPSSTRTLSVILKPEFATTKHLSAMVERFRAASANFAGYRFLIPSRPSIFRDPGKEFRIDIIGRDLGELARLERDLSGKLRDLPGVRNARSNFINGAPELEVRPNRERLAEVGLTEADLGSLVETALGGRLASSFVEGKQDLDVTVKLQAGSAQTPGQLKQLTLFGRGGKAVQLGDVAEVRDTIGPDVINHVDQERAVSITISLAPDAPLSQLVAQTETEILQPLTATLPQGYQVRLAGTANQLAKTVTQLSQAFAISLGLTYLMLIALYRSFIYPLVIMAVVPLGMSGALLSLVLANNVFGLTVPLDMITALGFLILTGIVVNNAILLVDRTLQRQETGEAPDSALYQATRDRLRPIFMSAGTSVIGMAPLAILPGQGSELYQGLGIVLTGGLAFSTLLTPTIVPALMGLLTDFTGRGRTIAPLLERPSQPEAATSSH